MVYAVAVLIGVTIGGMVPAVFCHPHDRVEWTVAGCYMAFCVLCTTTFAWVTLR